MTSMTREEQINEAVNTYMNGLFEDGIEIPIEDFENIEEGFIAGATWADKHPKSPWISVDDDLPCNHDSMICEVCKGVEYETNRVLVLLIDGTIEISYMFRLTPHAWHWNTYKVTHWMPLPELPKE